MPFKETYLNYRCPRYELMPSIELYKDQLINVLKDYTHPFSADEKLVTSSIINNYVKQKIIKPPVNKKYNREHLAFLYVLCLLKRYLPIEQIKAGIDFILKTTRLHQAYDMFCDEFENALQHVCGGSPIHEEKPVTKELEIIKAATSGLASFFLLSDLVNAIKTPKDDFENE